MGEVVLPSTLVASLAASFEHSSGSPLCLTPTADTPVSGRGVYLFFGLSNASPQVVQYTGPSAVTILPMPNSPVGVKLFLMQQLGVYGALHVSSSHPVAKSDFPLQTTSFGLVTCLLGS